VNPIDFENAEANAGVSSAILEHLASKLMVSRMQRDLSDSSAIRNMGLGIAHSGLALLGARKGLGKVSPSPEVMRAELEGQWEVLAEPIQTVMRRYGVQGAYEKLKEVTRGKTVAPQDLHALIRSLEIPQAEKDRLLAMTPASYIGKAADLARRA
jgi:adenylosuccinate lyase